jgi:hypothetical protein
VKTKHFPVINPFLCSNSVLKVAREVSADTRNQPKDDQICEDEEDDDGANDHQVKRGKNNLCECHNKGIKPITRKLLIKFVRRTQYSRLSETYLKTPRLNLRMTTPVRMRTLMTRPSA